MDPPTSGSSHISMLTSDILWSIFTLNTYLDPNSSARPLVTTRRTSQVCRRWRDLILHSPTIWANTVDFNDLKSEKWSRVVRKRTDKAPLTLYGLLNWSDMPIFWSWLDKFWEERIRVLDVWCANTNVYRDRDWEPLRRPALVLETLRIDGCPIVLTEKTETKKVLFANQAPRLKHFHCVGYYPDVKSSPWARTLTSVTLDYPYGIADLLQTLSSMPTLESVIFDSTHRKSVHDEEPVIYTGLVPTSISLPRLKEIAIARNIDLGDDVLFLLRSITPASNCSLHISHLHFQPTVTRGKAILELDYQSVISGYVQNAFKADRKIRSLSISAWQGAFTFNARHDTDIFNDMPSHPSPFSLTIGDHDISNYNSLFSGTLYAFLQGSGDDGGMNDITTFDFVLYADLFTPFWKRIENELEKIVDSFHRVTTLRASEATLSFLVEISRTRGLVAFPNLIDLRLASKTDIHGVMKVVNAFLQGRQGRDCRSLSTIDITEYASCRRHWGFLDGFKGLTVVWTRGGITSRYVCGTGDPNRLFL